MTDGQNELRQVNWTEVFSFTHLFKAFKMAIRPSNLLLALAALVLLFCVGWVMDGLWAMGGQTVASEEIYDYFSKPSSEFAAEKEQRKSNRFNEAASLVERYEANKYDLGLYISRLPSGELRTAFGKVLAKDNEGKLFSRRGMSDITQGKDWKSLLKEAKTYFYEGIDRAERLVAEAETVAKKQIKDLSQESDRQKTRIQLDQLDQDTKLAYQRLTEMKIDFARARMRVQGDTISSALWKYEKTCFGNALSAVSYGNLFGGLSDYRDKMRNRSLAPQAAEITQLVSVTAPIPMGDRPGFFYWCLLAIHGLCWLASQHWLYAIFFLFIGLVLMAFFGGAIHRMVAVQFAREEKISILQAIRFSVGKFLSFFTAPLIPVTIILVLGLALALGGLIFGTLLALIPIIGNFLFGLVFGISLILGLLIAFLSIGLVAGFPLMYPTIAVEGSDSFDSISRSFSYIFERPWRAAFYGLVALVYGVITYLFVRLFVYIALLAVHTFVGWGVIGGGASLSPDADRLDVMWAVPTFDRLFGPINWEAMNASNAVGGWMIGVWVFLMTAVVGAYLLTFAAASSSIIYFLLRRRVDATDLDDVFVEEEDEISQELIEAATTEEAGASSVSQEKE